MSLGNLWQIKHFTCTVFLLSLSFPVFQGFVSLLLHHTFCIPISAQVFDHSLFQDAPNFNYRIKKTINLAGIFLRYLARCLWSLIFWRQLVSFCARVRFANWVIKLNWCIMGGIIWGIAFKRKWKGYKKVRIMKNFLYNNSFLTCFLYTNYKYPWYWC